MEIKQDPTTSGIKIIEMPHPYLAGVICRSNGEVFVPANYHHKGHWTYGYRGHKGYCQVNISKKTYAVHRLMAETFLQCPIPDGMQIDHIDRCPSNNAKDNIRIVTPSENCRNRSTCVKEMADVVSSAADRRGYQRAYWANRPKHREKRNAYMRTYYANNPEQRAKARAYNHAYYAKKKAQGRAHNDAALSIRL